MELVFGAKNVRVQIYLPICRPDAVKAGHARLVLACVRQKPENARVGMTLSIRHQGVVGKRDTCSLD